jgi:hypothetical protein
MRYCPRCRRFNPGNPQICHFCSATWYVRLCPRGHENPPNAQFCGQCGSTDLSETAGRRPWLLITFKLFLWLLAGLLIYSVITSLANLPKNQLVFHLLSVVLAPCLLVIGFWFALSLLPQPIGRSVRKMVGHIMRLLGLTLRGLLELIWKVLR